MGIRLWNGNSFSVGVVGSSASCPLILGRDPLRLAEAYFQSDVDIEGDIFAALDLKHHLESLQIPVRDRLKAAMAALQLRALNARKSHRLGENVPSHRRQMRTHSKADNLKASRSYDAFNEFCRLWLDRSLSSCAYFVHADKSLWG
jgi:cyclopropane-fatty-acyl-phospholipid synthase